jgi:hypothetical protein
VHQSKITNLDHNLLEDVLDEQQDTGGSSEDNDILSGDIGSGMVAGVEPCSLPQ